ncbi:N-acetyl sugar amidotransferase [Gammaproteobacteria bacterium]|nr:N-acetyl sugar amidotransferase [Gammaproteobacteria bacterium]
MAKKIINYPSSVDLTEFKKDKSEVAKYGLPSNVKFCKKCVMTNQMPQSEVEHKHNISSKKKSLDFHDDGICAACHTTYTQKQVEIDWEERERQLKDLCTKYKSNNGSYDCICPGSGGKDSFYASYLLKYKYGMNPLTITWAPNIYTDWGWRNFQRWIGSGFDNHLITPNARVHRLLTRLSIENLLHPFQNFIVGQKSLAPKMAARLGIPLVFYGESDAEYGTGPQSRFDTPSRDMTFSSSSKDDNLFFGGLDMDTLQSSFGITRQDLDIYIPEDPEKLYNAKLNFHDLGWYLKWHPQSCYYFAHEKGGFEASPERTSGTYSKYSSIDDKIDDFHYYTTRVKFGIGRTTYDASQEIRSGEINREEAVALVKKFDHEYPERFSEEIFKYLSINEEEHPIAYKSFESPIITREYFDKLCDTFRSPHIWKYDDGIWRLRDIIS